jgi:hypothetical protein
MGDMGEVGEQGLKFHAEAGALAATCGINQLFTLGDLAAMLRLLSAHSPVRQHFHDMDSLTLRFMRFLPGQSVLVKGLAAKINKRLSRPKVRQTPRPTLTKDRSEFGRSGVSTCAVIAATSLLIDDMSLSTGRSRSTSRFDGDHCLMLSTTYNG